MITCTDLENISFLSYEIFLPTYNFMYMYLVITVPGICMEFFIIRELTYWVSVNKCFDNLIGIWKVYFHVSILYLFKLVDY